jgi:hypothetical protein
MFFFVIWHRTSLFCSSSKASQKAFLPDDVMFYSGQNTKHFSAQVFLCLSSNTILLRKVIAFVGCCVNSLWGRKLFSLVKKICALSRVKHHVLVTLHDRCEVLLNPYWCSKIKISAFPDVGEAMSSGPRRSAIPKPTTRHPTVLVIQFGRSR